MTGAAQITAIVCITLVALAALAVYVRTRGNRGIADTRTAWQESDPARQRLGIGHALAIGHDRDTCPDCREPTQ